MIKLNANERTALEKLFTHEFKGARYVSKAITSPARIGMLRALKRKEAITFEKADPSWETTFGVACFRIKLTEPTYEMLLLRGPS